MLNVIGALVVLVKRFAKMMLVAKMGRKLIVIVSIVRSAMFCFSS